MSCGALGRCVRLRREGFIVKKITELRLGSIVFSKRRPGIESFTILLADIDLSLEKIGGAELIGLTGIVLIERDACSLETSIGNIGVNKGHIQVFFADGLSLGILFVRH